MDRRPFCRLMLGKEKGGWKACVCDFMYYLTHVLPRVVKLRLGTGRTAHRFSTALLM